MAKSKKPVNISDAAHKDSYHIRAESLSSNLLAKKFKKYSTIEKVFYFSVVATIIVMAVAIIFVKTRIFQTEENLGRIQYNISQKKTKQEELNQQIQELSRSDRVLKIAEKENLKLNDKNIRKASK
ncbi:cell division protein FtsL [Streptococcaceae bacterium ESL0687]|nr:cell division protein FtsL [Streptococcaceae bacterium ESL0687]